MPSLQEIKDQVALESFGHTLTDAWAIDHCVRCWQPKGEFHDLLSAKEYTLSGLCQSCQDWAFEDTMYEDEDEYPASNEELIRGQ